LFARLQDYGVILLIPDLYDEVYVREMTDLLVRTMGFKQICLIQVRLSPPLALSRVFLPAQGADELPMCAQESVGATFGAGYSSACVIDIGSLTSTITCVEEGLVLPETRYVPAPPLPVLALLNSATNVPSYRRMVLDFGGDDITRFLMTLLQRLSFPYKDIDLAKWHDWIVVEELKERLVVLSEVRSPFSPRLVSGRRTVR